MSDAQWRNFRANLPILTIVFAIFGLAANAFRACFRFKARGMSFLWLFISFIYLTYLHGAWYACLFPPFLQLSLSLSLSLCVFIFLSFFGSIVFILAIALLNYLLVKVRFLLPSPPFSCLTLLGYNILFFALFYNQSSCLCPFS